MPHDFFLSHSSSDNEEALPGQPDSRWVTTFHGVLRNLLDSYLGRPAQIYFDEQDLSGNSALTPNIKTGLDDSWLLVAISSPTYYRRPWCDLERGHFLTKLGVNPGLAERVFVVHLMDAERLVQAPDHWQKRFFPDLRGYYFFREDKAGGGRMHTLGKPTLKLPIADADSYYEEMIRLAQDMAKRIHALEAAQAAAAPGHVSPATHSAAPAPPPADAVYLAENAFRSHGEREELRKALVDAGFAVWPEDRPVGTAPADPAAGMQGALAFVQIVSPVLLELVGRGGKTHDEAQLEAARAAKLPIFRWRAPDLDVAAAALNSPRYEAFALYYDVRAQLLPIFKEEVVGELKALRVSRQLKGAATGNDQLVLIVGDPADVNAHAPALTQALRAHALGICIKQEPGEDIQAEDVRGFLVLYGQSTPEWVQARLMAVRSLPKSRKLSLPHGVFFCSPPPPVNTRLLLYDTPSVHKISWNDPTALRSFVDAVAAATN